MTAPYRVVDLTDVVAFSGEYRVVAVVEEAETRSASCVPPLTGTRQLRVRPAPLAHQPHGLAHHRDPGR